MKKKQLRSTIDVRVDYLDSDLGFITYKRQKEKTFKSSL
jgi:hypothetical protein